MTKKCLGCGAIFQFEDPLKPGYIEEKNYIKNELFKIKKENANYKIAIIIGPEGGIEENEARILESAGAKIISLGKRILRTETVALQVSSIIMYELEDNGGN